jgi:diphthine-ammonia ligase
MITPSPKSLPNAVLPFPPFAFFSPLDELHVHSLTCSHIAHVNIFLASIEDFARMNAVYATYFGTSPPARACVALDLPAPIRVKLECIAFAEQTPMDRQALHVQGLSYWAPANIGPYSQAILVDPLFFF